MLIRPVKIFCTSNFPLEEVFSGYILSTLQARFNIFDRYDNTVKRRQESAPNWSVFDQPLKEEDGLAEMASIIPVPPISVENVPVPSTAEINVPVPCTSEKYIPAASRSNNGYSSSEEFQQKRKTRRNLLNQGSSQSILGPAIMFKTKCCIFSFIEISHLFIGIILKLFEL
ncbi:hypothetical protein AVEN_35235-1 [Araneus ventricosus]|uniref:Uncharacterized protein n=1 Tax=Araneus ventricosus TaxID=182803 RepID=A0A4Y2UB23_ARAVE|nr:hypothetical protein AVEN_35235-1 [Araneus ventricosus]